MEKFDLFELKKKLDDESASSRQSHEVTIGEKITKILVTALALGIVYSLVKTYQISDALNFGIMFTFIILLSLRTYFVFKTNKKS